MTREEYIERFCTPSSPDGCTALMLIEIVRLEAEVERLKQSGAELLGLAQGSTSQGEPEPDWHNPEGVESPGFGYRFCVKGESEDPPLTQWNGFSGWTSGGQQAGAPLYSQITYRTTNPLPKP